jgi:hypothetical protein
MTETEEPRMIYVVAIRVLAATWGMAGAALIVVGVVMGLTVVGILGLPVFGALGVFCVAAAVGLWRYRPWAWYAGLALSALSLVNSLRLVRAPFVNQTTNAVSMLLCAAYIYCLTRPEVRRKFQ